ncbi:MAG: ABC transporter ATP-binding protein [Acidobacteria bacterium]|nr:ABC transporter ATP-binding protein [Acidobacteriota bacterium]
MWLADRLPCIETAHRKTMAKQHGPLRRLLAHTRNHRGHVVKAVTYSILNKIFDLAPPALIGTAVDIVVRREDSFIATLGVENVTNQLYALAAVTVAIWMAESMFDYLSDVTWRNLAQQVQHDLRVEAYAHVQGLELGYFEDASTGSLMSILNDDVNQLERFLDVGADSLIEIATTVVLIGSLFLFTAPSVGWMAVVPMPFIVYGSMRFQKKLEPRYALVREQVGVLNTDLANNLGGVATIKSYTAESHEVARIRASSNEYRIRNKSAIKLSSAFAPLIRMVIVLGFVAILVYGGRLTLDGRLSEGLYSMLIFMTQRLLWPLTKLGETFDLYQRAMASTTRVMDVLDRPSQITDGTKQRMTRARGALEFDMVGFHYANGIPVLKDLSFKVAPGETIAIVGSTGAGKSTVVKLLLRFYDATEGAVTIDGIDVRDMPLEDLRRSIGLVSQDVYLFDGTVRDNVGYGSFDATDAEIIEASTIAEAHDFIMSLPDGYDTLVGERGIKLSGGQRQRVSIARAILKNPPILVLDEATSSVDNETEAAIQRSLEKITVDRTTVIIAHRLSTVRNADHIFVLENGAIKETGRHDDLIAIEGGVYQRLWNVQTGGGNV